MSVMTSVQSRKLFHTQKTQTLNSVDLSRKGSIDQPIRELIEYLNDQDNYFTLSSCSGRVAVFEQDPGGCSIKKGCRWLYMTHGHCDSQDTKDALEKSTGNASVKFEPFVLHVQCCHLENAQALHAEAVAAGFRNSGISVSKKGKIVLAVRSTHSMEVPCTHSGALLVSAKYIDYICDLANAKMAENLDRINRFFEGLKTLRPKSLQEGVDLESSVSQAPQPHLLGTKTSSQPPHHSNAVTKTSTKVRTSGSEGSCGSGVSSGSGVVSGSVTESVSDNGYHHKAVTSDDSGNADTSECDILDACSQLFEDG